MSDTTSDVVETEKVTEDKGTQAVATDAPDLSSEVEKWKALSRKNEERAKANAAAAKKLEEIEAAQLSETERLTKRAEEAEKKAAELATRTLKSEVAAAKGVPAELLTGSTQEELEASAEALLKFKGPDTTSDFGAGRVGTTDIGDGKTEQISREQLKKMTPQEIVEAKKAGRLDDVLGLS